MPRYELEHIQVVITSSDVLNCYHLHRSIGVRLKSMAPLMKITGVV